MWTGSISPPRESRPTSADASRWMRNTAPNSRTFLRWAMSSDFPAWRPFRWSKGASPPPRHLACTWNPILPAIPMGFTRFQISFIGKTEEQLTEEDVPYEVGVAYYREIARGQISGHTDGRLKLLFHRQTLELLGVHI